LFYKGVLREYPLDDVNEIIGELKSQLDYLYALKSDDLIEFFDTLAEYWRNNKELEKKTSTSLKHLADFICRDSMTKMLNFALRGDYHVLDKCVDFGQPSYVFTCQPRGLVVHWLAGNVPILGLYSIIQSMVTKNTSLIKASSHAYKELLLLLDSFNKVDAGKIKGKDIIKTICVVLIDKEDTELQNIISQKADVRVAWGGKEAIETIIHLKRNIFSEDIIFGPKYSYGVIDKKSLEEYSKIAQRLALDVSTFDQYACSSPHTIFIEKGGKVSPLEFAEELAKHMDFVNKKMIKKDQIDPQKTMDILSVRAKYNMIGKVMASENTDWTIVYDEGEGLSNPCFSRVVFVKPINSIEKLTELNSRKIQTIGCAIDSEYKNDLMRKISRKGADRCPKFGDMTLYESPWDGFFAMDKLVRWISVYK